MNLRLTLLALGLLASVGLSAFFAAAETALVSLGRIDLQRMREQGDRRGAIIRGLRSQTSKLLATILIGQNLFNSTAAACATLLFAGLWGDTWLSTLAAVLFATLVLFVFGEMTPKAIGAASPVSIARSVAVPVAALMKLFSPLATLVVRITRGALRLLGVPEKAPTLTEEEMKSVINLGADEGIIHGEERRLLHKVLEFGDRIVRDLMVPRTRVVAIPETASFAQIRAVLREHKLSRLPVYRGSLDNVVGILHAKDLFDVRDEEEAAFDLRKYLDPPFLVPESLPAEDLFREMRRRRNHMAVVVDEYGGTAGIATIEDAIEELLGGAIQDEHDEEGPGFVPAGERTYVLEGGFRLDDIQEQFGLDLPRDEAETIAGHLLLRFGRIPRKGERWKSRRGADFVVEEATPTAVKKVRMILHENPAGRSGERSSRPENR
ncbi:MAG TPA: hemolysin family protein [Thermoanaerobaculia bacterium]|jgi:CBS domain containing-hemolysin-like protein